MHARRVEDQAPSGGAAHVSSTCTAVYRRIPHLGQVDVQDTVRARRDAPPVLRLERAAHVRLDHRGVHLRQQQ